MERRRFIKKTSLGLSAFFFLPSFFKESFAKSNAINGELYSFANVNGQIRHGALTLPQIGFKNEQISFDWLHDISRNVFFQNGFIKGKEEEDMEITSILLNPANNNLIESIQIQTKGSETILLVGDQEYRLAHENRGLKLLTGEKTLELYFGNLETASSETINLEESAELFIYLLKGEMQVNGIDLKRNVGLGLKDIFNLKFECKAESQFLYLQKR